MILNKCVFSLRSVRLNPNLAEDTRVHRDLQGQYRIGYMVTNVSKFLRSLT